MDELKNCPMTDEEILKVAKECGCEITNYRGTETAIYEEQMVGQLLRKFARAIISRIQGQAEPVAGWRLVPAEPDDVMWVAASEELAPVIGEGVCGHDHYRCVQAAIRAAISIAPSPPAAHAPSDAVPLNPEEVEQCFMAWGHPAQDFHVAFLKDDIQDVARLLFRKAAAGQGDAVKELVEALEHCKNVFRSYEINRIDGEEIGDNALKIICAALAKHGTQAATSANDFDTWAANPYTKVLQGSIAKDYVPVSDLTAYGEKVREAVQEAISPILNGCTVSKYATSGECRAARDMAERIKLQIRTMPLPAQSEGEEK